MTKRERETEIIDLTEEDGQGVQDAFYLTRISQLAPIHNRHAIGLADILKGDIQFLVQINYMVDVDFIVKSIQTPKRLQVPLLVIHGLRPGQVPQETLERWASEYPNVTMHRQALPFAYGTHHSKLMILFVTTILGNRIFNN